VRDESERQDAKGMEDTRLYVEELIRKEREDGRKVVLGGFSQGLDSASLFECSLSRLGLS
jgi:predicted esterase